MDKILGILIERYLYTVRTTIGRLYFLYDGKKEYFCYTLEDTARPDNIKVYSETCLPGGLECDVSLFENEHYKKTIIFHTEKDGVTIKVGELTWTGCLAHNGMNFDHTAGCVLVGDSLNQPVYKDKIIVTEPTIYSGSKDGLRILIETKIKKGYIIKAQFVNLTQLT